MTAKPSLSKILSLFLLLVGTGCLPHGPILIESKESKTEEGSEVYNIISLEESDSVDTWKMKQSHNGHKYPQHLWDEIMIKIDKTTEPKIVSYYQMKNGKEIELKATCFQCHANGPRVIRPNEGSKLVQNTLSEKLRIWLWNFKIKSYGKSLLDKIQIVHYQYKKVPLKFSDEWHEDTLEIKTCLYCHNNDSWWGRGKLKRQHAGAIKHMVSTGAMPPFPFSLSTSEKKDLEKFLKGF